MKPLRLFLASFILLACAPGSQGQALFWTGANDNPDPLINGSFNGATLTFNAEIASGGSTTGTTTSLAFNQTRVFTSVAGCTLVAQTHNNSNNVSIYFVNAAGATFPVAGSPFTTAAGTQSLAWAPDGGALYVPLAVAGASQVITFTVSCTPGGPTTVTNAGTVALTGFNLLRDAEVVGPGVGSHLCVSGTNSNNVGCFAINSVTRLPNTTAVNTVTVTNVRGLRIAPNGCGTAGVGSALTVQALKVTAGTVALANTGVPTTNPRYGAMSADGTLAAWGGFGTQFSLFSVNATTCDITLVTSNNNGITTSLVEYMAFDGVNRLYVADSLANQVRVFQATTSALTLLTTSLTNHATLNAPAGMDAALLSAVPVELQRFGIE